MTAGVAGCGDGGHGHAATEVEHGVVGQRLDVGSGCEVVVAHQRFGEGGRGVVGYPVHGHEVVEGVQVHGVGCPHRDGGIGVAREPGDMVLVDMGEDDSVGFDRRRRIEQLG